MWGKLNFDVMNRVQTVIVFAKESMLKLMLFVASRLHTQIHVYYV